jgi:hypothetical protein
VSEKSATDPATELYERALFGLLDQFYAETTSIPLYRNALVAAACRLLEGVVKAEPECDKLETGRYIATCLERLHRRVSAGICDGLEDYQPRRGPGRPKGPGRPRGTG